MFYNISIPKNDIKLLRELLLSNSPFPLPEKMSPSTLFGHTRIQARERERISPMISTFTGLDLFHQKFNVMAAAGFDIKRDSSFIALQITCVEQLYHRYEFLSILLQFGISAVSCSGCKFLMIAVIHTLLSPSFHLKGSLQNACKEY
jgi:hypothetical protein